MKNPVTLSNQELIHETVRLVREELRIGVEVLAHLREVERRKLYLERGHSSLFAFCLRELGYSEPQAQLRIDAMRAIRDTPEIEAQIRQGSLAVTTAAKVQRFLRKEKAHSGKAYSSEAKLALFERVQGKSTREVEQELFRESPESVQIHERERVVSADQTELKLVIPEELRGKLESLKALYSHRMKDVRSTVELLEILAADALRRAKPDANVAPISPKVSAIRSRYISASLRRAVWKRDQGRCSYQDPESGQSCGSTLYLQIDHRTPFSLGGSSEDPENLRLVCGAHNRFAWNSTKRQLSTLAK